MDAQAAERVVVIGASAGGPLAVGTVLATLPQDLDAAVLVVVHVLAGHRSLLAEVLRRRTALPVKQAEIGDVLEAGHVYVAPPDAHLLVRADRTIALGDDPPLRFHRPSLDVTLESAAGIFGDATTAVVLSGTGNDGAAGIGVVKAAGGIVLAQEADAEQGGMPRAAVSTGSVDQVLPLAGIGAAIVERTGLAAV